MSKHTFTLLFALLICVMISLIIVSFVFTNISVQKNTAGEIELIQIYNIGYIIESNIFVVPFLMIPVFILFYSIRYLIIFCKSLIVTLISNNSRNISNCKLFRLPSKDMLKNSIAEILSLIILPLSIYIIYYYPFKSTYKFVDSPHKELLLSAHYMYPKKPRVESYTIEAIDSLLIHLWDPSFSGPNDGTPTGQVFLYYKNAIKQIAPFTGDTIIREQHSRKELFTGSQDMAKKLGTLLYEISGATTIVNNVEGNFSVPVSHEVLPEK